MFLYCSVKETVSTLCHVIALRPEVTDLINISNGKGYHHTLNDIYDMDMIYDI